MPDQELLACPFCGRAPIIKYKVENDGAEDDNWLLCTIFCPNMACGASVEDGRYGSKDGVWRIKDGSYIFTLEAVGKATEAALTIWNRRAGKEME